MVERELITAKQAAARLGISVTTLYAYVSRGLLHSVPGDSAKRTRLYAADEVDRLAAKKEQRRDPARVAQQALNWGSPVLDSAITRIDVGELYYRGEHVGFIDQRRSVEQVASMIWRDTADAIKLPNAPDLPPHVRQIEPLFARIHAALAFEEARDETAFDLRTPAVIRTGARIFALMVETVAGRSAKPGIAKALSRAWAPKDEHAEELISSSLIMCADHELNISAFTARCVASAGSTPYAVVGAGLHALAGVKHGGESLRTEALLNAIGPPNRARAHVSAMLRRGERVPGFGHRLYPEGDPRAKCLLAKLRSQRRSEPVSAALARAMEDLTGEHPTIDFALATIARVLALPAGSPLVLFALGRTIGFIGHAIEQYETDVMIRPRARYVGR